MFIGLPGVCGPEPLRSQPCAIERCASNQTTVWQAGVSDPHWWSVKSNVGPGVEVGPATFDAGPAASVGVVSGTVKRTKNRLKPDAAFASVFQGLPEYARRVLDVVDQIPAGKVMAYGDIAEYLAEGGPRQVAQVMSRYGSPVPWHRVLRADGSCAPEVSIEQYKLLAEESVVWRRSGRVDMSQSRWDGS